MIARQKHDRFRTTLQNTLPTYRIGACRMAIAVVHHEVSIYNLRKSRTICDCHPRPCFNDWPDAGHYLLLSLYDFLALELREKADLCQSVAYIVSQL